MTNEFAIKVLTELKSYGDKFANIGFDRKEALDLAIKALEQTRWIPCSEKQPDKTGQYLVTIKYRHDEKGYKYMTARRDYYADYKTWNDSLVIAWQPLPEPYTEGSGEE